MRVCSTPGCPNLIPKPGRCPTHAQAHERARGSRQTRGYNADHDRERARWAPLVRTGTINCARCGQPIKPAAPWDLDHSDDRQSYLGPAHARCNRQAGGQKAH